MKFLILAGLLASPSAFGWGNMGHRATALIAEAYLTPQAAQEVRTLLDHQRLVDIASWADSARSLPEFNRTGSYHFHNMPDIHALPSLPTYAQTLRPNTLPPGPQAGVVEALLKAEEMLVDSRVSKERRQIALKFLVHFIGDLHQPLHVGQGSDRGGNSIKMKWNGRDTNLHQLWDSVLFADHQVELGQIPAGPPPPAPSTANPGPAPGSEQDPALAYARWLEQNYANAVPPATTEGRPDIWLRESRGFLPFIYNGQAQNAPQAYYDRARPVADTRLRFAGLRIASTLNRLFANRRLGPTEMDLITLIRKTLGDLDRLINLDPQAPATSPAPSPTAPLPAPVGPSPGPETAR